MSASVRREGEGWRLCGGAWEEEEGLLVGESRRLGQGGIAGREEGLRIGHRVERKIGGLYKALGGSWMWLRIYFLR